MQLVTIDIAIKGLHNTQWLSHTMYGHNSQFQLIKSILYLCILTFENMMSIVVPVFSIDLQNLVPIEHSLSEQFVQEEITDFAGFEKFRI